MIMQVRWSDYTDTVGRTDADSASDGSMDRYTRFIEMGSSSVDCCDRGRFWPGYVSDEVLAVVERGMAGVGPIAQ
jgi:hypothetical protein